MMMTMMPPPIPREHGAWAMLLIPMVVGVIATGSVSINVFLLIVATLGLFFASVPSHALLRASATPSRKIEGLQTFRFWTGVYLSIVAACVVPLVYQGYWHLLTIGFLVLAALIGFLRSLLRGTRTIRGDLIAVAGLTLSAPAGYYASTGNLDFDAVNLWFLNALFFGSTVIYVHMKIRARSTAKSELSWGEKFSIGKLNLAYHGFVVPVAALLALMYFTTELALIAFLPMVVHAVIGTARLSGKVHFRKLGFILLAQSAMFGILLSLYIRKPL